MTRIVSIAGASGMWGDSTLSTPQLLTDPDLNYITYECLAEITMAIMTRAKLKDHNAGYATDVIQETIPAHLSEIASRGIKVITNAGGVNPKAAAEALRSKVHDLGLSLKIATVFGDDAMPHLDTLQQAKVKELDRDTAFPKTPISANAYLGAFPIAAALDAGADIVVTGRVVDSALTLGPLIHEFGWTADDYDKLSQGSLAGHLIECGPQSTGGLLTDWDEVESWANIGFPIVRVSQDGAFDLTKPPHTDGSVTVKSATEQILYEIGDPAAYCLPDVTCDLRDVQLTQTSMNTVRVSGAKGRAPGPNLKLCAQEARGWRLQWIVSVTGRDAVLRAERTARDLVSRLRSMLTAKEFADFEDVSIEVLGGEQSYGPRSKARASREVALKLAFAHADRSALTLVAHEVPSIGLAMAQGLSAGGTGRPRPVPIIHLHSFLVPRDLFLPQIEVETNAVPYSDPVCVFEELEETNNRAAFDPVFPDGPTVTLPLMAIAYGRSGDKGNRANIGVAARHRDFLPLIRDQITAEVVLDWFNHLVSGPVTRFTLPGLMAYNFLIKEALGGGGTASLRFDPQGKAFGQILLDVPVQVPIQLLTHPSMKQIAEVRNAIHAN
ncbi:acyclic terpene utilization AtuA family protein [Shimia sediminis]|uniref:acyclic terpene utilization AtuA family protein n=1 Tax=Shimia sediminis TaxID=2497945 RepID=UPI000F8E2FA9|nr:acyclic terpene utilization AtuA family protein [Shimia sediminis]